MIHLLGEQQGISHHSLCGRRTHDNLAYDCLHFGNECCSQILYFFSSIFCHWSVVDLVVGSLANNWGTRDALNRREKEVRQAIAALFILLYSILVNVSSAFCRLSHCSRAEDEALLGIKRLHKHCHLQELFWSSGVAVVQLQAWMDGITYKMLCLLLHCTHLSRRLLSPLLALTVTRLSAAGSPPQNNDRTKPIEHCYCGHPQFLLPTDCAWKRL